MRKPILSLLFLLCFASVATAQQSFTVGDTVPTFKLPYATADSIFFEGIGPEDFKDQRFLMAFYPADWSSGCTKEMCTFRDSFEEFSKLSIEVLPISGDYVFSHHEWAKHHKLPFKLVADHTRTLGMMMGVYRDDWGMFKRSVFLIGPDGRFEYIDYEYSVRDEDDFDRLREFLNKLN